MNYSDALRTLMSVEWRVALRDDQSRIGRNVIEQLTWLQNKVARRPTRLPRDFHAVWYSLSQELHHIADMHEHAAMRDLHERGRSWEQVGEGLEHPIRSRQGILHRYKALDGRLSHPA